MRILSFPRLSASRARAPRVALARPLRVLAASAALLLATGPGVAPAALAAAGSGTADILLNSAVVAGTRGIWTISYTAAEDFARPSGGVVEIEIPAGWTPPQNVNPIAPGWVSVQDSTTLSSMTISGQTIRLLLGAASQPQFNESDVVSVIYGRGGGNARPYAQSVAPATALFTVRSDPAGAGAPLPIAVSPSLAVTPDVVTHVRIVDDALAPVGALNLTTDDTLSLHLRGFDQYDNPVRLVSGTWTVTGGIGGVAPVLGDGTLLSLSTPGAGVVIADSAAWVDSTGVLAVAHGSYAGLAGTFAPTAAAGTGFAASVEARDADGNRVTTGVGALAAVRFAAFADSLGPAPADPDLQTDTATLSSGLWTGSLVARRSGVYWLAAIDTLGGLVTGRSRVAVGPGPAYRIALAPDTLALVAGAPDTVTLRVFDLYWNRAPLASGEAFLLWTDRPAGGFSDISGAGIFELDVPAGADSAQFRFADTQATAAAGRIRAIDADGAAPFLGSALAMVTTGPAEPAGTIALAAAPDTLVAAGVDSTLVSSGVIRDAYGNPVAAGERFTLTGSGLTALTDEDPAAPGAQLLADVAGRVAGRLRAALVAGAASAGVVSERGSAAGSAPVWLRPGVPAGAIVLAAPSDSLAADSLATAVISAAGLVDANGNTVEDGEAITVATTLGAIVSPDADGGTPGVQVPAAGGGIAFQLLGGDVLGLAGVTAVSVRGTAAGSLDLRIVPGDLSAVRSTVTAASPVPVGPAGSAITVSLRDAQDHPIAGVPADSLDVVVSGAAAAVAAVDAATDASGTIRYLATATAADTGTVSVTARGTALAAAPGLVFTHGPLDHYSVAGPAGPLTAGSPRSLSVAALDSYGNPLPDRSGDVLRVGVVSGGAAVPDSVLLSAGGAAVAFTPTLAAPLTIEVRDDSARATTYGPVAVTPGVPHRLTALPPPVTEVAAGDSLALRALVTDAQGNAVAGAGVTAAVVAGTGSVAPAAATTDPAGHADVTLHAGGVPGSLTLRLLAPASAAPDSVRADSVTVLVTSAAAASIAIAAPAGGVAGGPAAVVVTLRDAFGNVARGSTPVVWLRTTTPAGALDNVSWAVAPPAAGALADSAGSDGASYAFAPADSGVATLSVRDTLAETIRLRVSGAGLPAAESGDLVLGPAAPSALAPVSGDGQAAIVDRALAAPLRVRVLDAFGNTVPGAAVAFRVAAGNGSVDAVAGGAADSLAAADGAGIAACEAARVGTVAGAGSDAFRAGLPAAPAPEVIFTASALPDTASTLALAPGSLALAPSTTQDVTVTARDRFGNPAPATPITFYLGAPAAGSLEATGGTSGTATSQSGLTGTGGALSVRYRAPAAAPAADSLFARGVSIGPVALRAATGPDTTVALRVLPDVTVWTAGVPARVRVQAVDAYGNLVAADGAVVTMQPAGSVSWAPPAGPLAGGEFVTFGTDPVAETVISSASHARGPTGSSTAITVEPAAPAGVIPVAASRDTLTADGRSTAAVSLGPVRDAFGNVVPAGTLLLVSASLDSLIAPDARPDLPGLDLATAGDGTAALVLRAGTAPGADTLRVTSRVGTGSGSRGFTLLPPPSLVAIAGSLAPGEVTPGGSAAFRVDVSNPGAASIRLDPGTILAFGAGPSAFSAPLAAAVTVPAGGGATLAFATAAVAASLTPGLYAPSLRAVGQDGAGDPFDFYLDLGGAQVSVIGLLVSAVGAAPANAPLGYGALNLVYDIANPSGTPATVSGASVTYSVGGFTESAPPSPAIPAAIPAGNTLRLTMFAKVPAGGVAPGTLVDATLTVAAVFSASTVVAASTVPVTFAVVSAARVTASQGSATPARYLRGRTFAPSVRVRNSGALAVTLGRDSTRLRLDGPGVTLTAALSANAVVAAGDSATLAFDSLAVGAAAPKGVYAASLVLRGMEAGEAYADSIPLDPPGVAVVDPALLAVVPGSLAPDTVSAGQTRAVSLTLANAGDADFALDAATGLVLGAPVGGSRLLGAAVTVPAGGAVPLVFAAAPVGSASAPGTAAVALAARGLEDGIPRAETLVAGALEARPPSALAFVAGTTSPATASAGSTADFVADVQNRGGSPFLLDPAVSRLMVSDGVDAIVAMGSGAAAMLGPGESRTLSFPGAAIPAGLARQAYAVTLALHGAEWGQAESVLVASPAGELSVLEPALSIQARGLDVGAPTQVAPDAFSGRVWGIVLEPLAPPGTSVQVTLDELRVTVLADGAPTAAPGTLLSSLSLRDASGALLAQASPGGANPVPLPIAGGRALAAQPDSLYLEFTLRPGAAAGSLALSIAAASDAVATDALTGAPALLVAAGGLPFAPLVSREVTLFARVHGYPNPFRAGREATRLSYVLAADAPVTITVYTLLGDVVREISLPAGAAGGARGLNEVPWDGRNGKGVVVRPGVYVARIEGGGVSQAVKVGVLR